MFPCLFCRQGEPGVGKTLLVEECGREWRREGVQVRAGCTERALVCATLNDYILEQNKKTHQPKYGAI